MIEFGFSENLFCGFSNGPFGEGPGIFGPGGGNATYSFGTPTGTTVGSTLTETITSGTHTTTIVYTETQAATSTSPALYQITPPAAASAHEAAEHGGASTTATTPTFSFTTGSAGLVVTETINLASSTETLTFTGGSQLTESLVTVTTPSATTANGGTLTYSFTAGSSGTTVTETVSNGSISHSFVLPTNPTAVFAATTLGSTAVETQTSAAGNTVQTITYINTSGTNYVVASTDTLYIPQGTATTALNINAFDRAEISISGSSTTVTPVNASGTALTSFTAPSSNSFAVVTPTTVPAGLPAAGSFVEETITHGTHVDNVLFYSATGTSGIYTEVAHAATIDVTGVAAQLSHLPSAVLALL